jgi:hypothetical protein
MIFIPAVPSSSHIMTDVQSLCHGLKPFVGLMIMTICNWTIMVSVIMGHSLMRGHVCHLLYESVFTVQNNRFTINQICIYTIHGPHVSTGFVRQIMLYLSNL